MKNNSLLTYVLYGLLALILMIAGYYACQKQKDKKLKQEQNEAELQETLRKMGYSSEDSTAATGSSFAGDSLSRSSAAKPKVNKDGIEEDGTGSTAATTKPATKPTTTVAAPSKPAPTTSTSTSTTTAKPAVKPTATTATTTAKGVAGPGTGRWAVRAGTFSYMEGARRRLEEVIKAGYPNAEISKTSDGKAAVVVFRSNDKTAAIRVVDKLEDKGIDAAVFDRKN
jgi:cell division septation protein DedD